MYGTMNSGSGHKARTRTVLFAVLGLACQLSTSHVIPPYNDSLAPQSFYENPLHSRKEDDPTSFGWVRRFAAIGDSYTSGVGSGLQLGGLFHNLGDWWCSRYDLSYPMMVKNELGSGVEDMQYTACMGDQIPAIYDQAKALKGDIDLLTLTAGGNDLCLADIIKNCVVLPFFGEESCNEILKKAKDNLDNIVGDGISQLLTALDDKMAKDGIVVYNSYAQFFNTENEDCATKQSWALTPWIVYVWPDKLQTPLTMTVARRKKFNELTVGLNDLIRKKVNDMKGKVKYNLGFSSWDVWPSESVKGRMCDPSSTGSYPDPKQPDLLFFKPDTRNTWFKLPGKKRRVEDDQEVEAEEKIVHSPQEGEAFAPLTKEDLEQLRAAFPEPPKRDLDSRGVDRSIYRSSLWNSVNPSAAALKKLDARAPSPPGCPGDPGPWMPNLGKFLPDFFGRIFHPNEDGHNAMASFMVAKTIDMRAKVLGLSPEVCKITDEFKCSKKDGGKAYATANTLDETYKKFCEDLKPPGDDVYGWTKKQKYYEGTLDEHEYVLSLEVPAQKYDKQQCLDSMERIIHGCDGSDPENPMNWKFGGKWKRDEYTYEVNIKRDNRPWPAPKEADGWCKGKYKFLFSDFEMKGKGWSSWDYGQDTLLKKARDCLGKGVTKWKFEYFDKPDEDGYEWKSTFRTPVFVSNRCFRNNKVAFGAGGFTHGCTGDSGA
ncbi:hypothetical protein LMH87_007327 [Akanthomyces muscarius]|uniref:SGNH hydrolase-type esterase domain-containing protein n=1 Tax=Akanthomyces muscarius TaxID=2231603 RepID=A0A9W8QPH6_AKAMU|nr:hypothetical protein LMH87_007327 [Akanthomyces muscarius]KAJ4165706.1 hypothetical protein LMH87_007327 [Akanthomyces muscarius]